MYAIIRTGGKQYKVEAGDEIWSKSSIWKPVLRFASRF